MNFEKASFFRRLGAALIDGIIVGIFGAVLGAIIGMSGDVNVSVTNGLSMIISIGYYLATYMNMEGKTIGKKALGIQVIKKDGTPMTDPFSIIIRDVVGKFISGAVILLGYFWMLFDKNNQTWHDKIAGTYVVKVNGNATNSVTETPVQPNSEATMPQEPVTENTNQETQM